MKKIISLTNVFIKEFYENLPIFDKTSKKFNKRSAYFWLLAIIFFGVLYVSYDIIHLLEEVGQEELFLNWYFPLLAMILAIQAVVSCANIFFFSKDIENVLYMPIKPTQLLIAKLNTLLFMLYLTEGLVSVFPLIMYGLLTGANFLYFFWEIIILLVFPIFIALVVSILMLIIMRFAKFIRNKDVFQFVITIALMAFVFILEYQLMQGTFSVQSEGSEIEQAINLNDRAQSTNKYLLIVNPAVNMLLEPERLISVLSFLKIAFYNLAAFLLFIVIGRKTYLKDILRNMINTTKYKKREMHNLKSKLKFERKSKSYIKKEFTCLIKEPAFFMQCVFPVLAILIACIILVWAVLPIVIKALDDPRLGIAIENFQFNTEVACDILVILQVLFSISNISLTAISRDGRNAIFVKYIPIDLYKQFLYKNVPQIVLNLIITIVVLGLIWHIISSIKVSCMLMLFVIATFINFINSFLMLIVDLRRPNLDWDAEYAVVRKSDNKIFQYAFMIINILFLFYVAKVLKNIAILKALVIEAIVFMVIFVIINMCVKKWKQKLFNKII